MAIEQMFTSLPVAGAATMQDIICAVQGYVSPSNLGLSVQQTLGQIFTLFQSNVVLSNAGNPNGVVAGQINQMCWDSADGILWICTATGTASTAIWAKTITLTAGAGIMISQAGSNITISSNSAASNFVAVTGTSQAMLVNTTYQANNAGLVTLTLPATSAVNDRITVTGLGAGGWTIAQNSGQNIRVGNVVSTTGVGGSVASTHFADGISLICSVANTTWQTFVSPQGIMSIT